MDIEFSVMVEPVEQASPSEPICVEPHVTLRQVLELLKHRNSSGVLVCRDGRLIGIFTERDALRTMVDRIDLSTAIDAVMTDRPVTVRRETAIGTAIRRMCAGGYRRLPIVDDENRPVGIVQMPGIVRFLVEHFPRTIYNLPPAPQAVMQQREGP